MFYLAASLEAMCQWVLPIIIEHQERQRLVKEVSQVKDYDFDWYHTRCI